MTDARSKMPVKFVPQFFDKGYMLVPTTFVPSPPWCQAIWKTH